MAYEFKNLSDVDQLDQLSDSTTIMGFENGKPVQFSSNKVGSVKTVNGSAPDENGNIEIQIATDIDWDGLNNKPFNEEGIINVEALPEALQFGKTTVQGDTLEWDGNTEGRFIVEGVFCKVSDAVPTMDDLANGFEVSSIIDGVEQSLTFGVDRIEDSGEALVLADEAILIVYKIDENSSSTETGVYFMNLAAIGVDGYISRFTIPGYSGFTKTEVKTIDEEFLPDSVKGADNALYCVIRKNAENDGIKCSHTVSEIYEAYQAGKAVFLVMAFSGTHSSIGQVIPAYYISANSVEFVGLQRTFDASTTKYSCYAKRILLSSSGSVTMEKLSVTI